MIGGSRRGVKVGVQKFRIRSDPWLEALGEFDMEKQQITMRAGLNRVTYAATLLHEILHAISDTLGGGLSEEQVRCVEQGLCQAAQHNPTLFTDLIGDLVIEE